MKRIVLFFTLLMFVVALVACGGYSYKPLAANSLVNAKVAVVYDFDWKTTTKGLFSGLIASAVVSEKTKKLIDANIAIINTTFQNVIKENISSLAPEVIIEENAIFKGSDYEVNAESYRFKKLVQKGFTHIILIDFTPQYVHRTAMSTDTALMNFSTKIINIKTISELSEFSVYPEIQFNEKHGGKNWKMEEIVGNEENSPKYFLKAVLAGIKFFIPKAMNYIKTTKTPRIGEAYNGELFMRKQGTF